MEGLGWDLALCGDQNGDGAEDIFVGAPRGESVGSVYLISGRDGSRLRTFRTDPTRLRRRDVAELAGTPARLRIADRATGGWGHVSVDHIVLADAPRSGHNSRRLAAYRASPGYYREPWRPQFHFTPEIHWMNDPNGLVFHDGEYHLFYQYNPWGIRWGHMSWGHAVSRDLVRWEHLPIALYEEDGVMEFSGSCVVDHRNTSGFGQDGQAPIVAIWTGHRSERQDQRLAYSNDRGRTWTKYAKNPVLDVGEKDFRDPKVFWHAPSERWVMVVSLAAAKVLRFYTSKDLREWELASSFGPAGHPAKPNWECPDLFELPIDGEPGKTRWVLEADMGSGSIAGGSGGEYFAGTFDGREFRPDEPLDHVRWVDWGRDFYAPVSFSDIPAPDGRRIWIGWMNNWETCLLPTDPWRSAQSIPRVLSLRRVPGDGLRLVQRPVRELEALRSAPRRIEDRALTSEPLDLASDGVCGTTLEISARIRIDAADEVAVEVRRGAGETTVIAYDATKQELSIDRRRSGNVAFHPAFAGKHAAPLAITGGRLELRIFVDASSVEVFADDGLVAITDRIFPAPASDGVSAWAKGGAATIERLDAWTLRSIWR